MNAWLRPARHGIDAVLFDGLHGPRPIHIATDLEADSQTSFDMGQKLAHHALHLSHVTGEGIGAVVRIHAQVNHRMRGHPVFLGLGQHQRYRGRVLLRPDPGARLRNSTLSRASCQRRALWPTGWSSVANITGADLTAASAGEAARWRSATPIRCLRHQRSDGDVHPNGFSAARRGKIDPTLKSQESRQTDTMTIGRE